MDISVERTTPGMQGTRPHFSPEPSQDRERRMPPEPVDGPRCEHGHADVLCTQLYDASELARRYAVGATVKIGWSARHPTRGRLSQLLEGTISTERDIHRRFSVHKLSGEWFERHEDILAYFTEHGLAV